MCFYHHLPITAFLCSTYVDSNEIYVAEVFPRPHTEPTLALHKIVDWGTASWNKDQNNVQPVEMNINTTYLNSDENIAHAHPTRMPKYGVY